VQGYDAAMDATTRLSAQVRRVSAHLTSPAQAPLRNTQASCVQVRRPVLLAV
jgi:hypothetical protein